MTTWHTEALAAVSIVSCLVFLTSGDPLGLVVGLGAGGSALMCLLSDR
jgi:hypothetical protein